MNNPEPDKSNIVEYDHFCQRDRTDGTIFWNKVTVLIGVNFGLFGVLSLRESALDVPLRMIINISGFLFSCYWWIVLYRQAKWVSFWKEALLKMEGHQGVKLTVQTQGIEFEKKITYLDAGSYRCVAHVLPISFIILWIYVLFYFLEKIS